MVEFVYKDSNNNSEFINEIVDYIYHMLGDIYWSVSDLDIIANDNEELYSNKPMFSERVVNFEAIVRKEHGLYITTEELSEIIFESRTIRKMALACFKNTIPKLRQYIPLVESDINNIKCTQAILEIRILDGDLIFLIGNDGINLDGIKGKFEEFLK